MSITKQARKRKPNKPLKKQCDADLDQMIEEATVDAHDESEHILGLYTMMEEYLELPFSTSILGIDVNVDGIEFDDAGQIAAVCSRGRTRQRISLLEVPLPKPPPRGAKWIEAYRCWVRGR